MRLTARIVVAVALAIVVTVPLAGQERALGRWICKSREEAQEGAPAVGPGGRLGRVSAEV